MALMCLGVRLSALFVPAIAQALPRAGNDKFMTVRLPGLSHPFQTVVTGAASEYVRIDETIAPAALETITQWIRR